MFNCINSINTVNSRNSRNNRNNIAFGAKPISKETALSIKNKLLGNGTIGIYDHGDPDNDAAGAGKVMVNWLRKHHQIVDFFVENKNLKILELNECQISSEYHKTNINLFLDFNSSERLPNFVKKVGKSGFSGTNLGIDHHLATEKKIKGDFYIDSTAKACCAVIYRFFEALGEKLQKKDLKNLYTGILSDYNKSKLIEFKDFKVVKLPKLDENPDAKEVLEKIEEQLSPKDKAKIVKKLDVLSNLTKAEKAFQKRINSEIKVTPNGKVAYVAISPDDEQWASLGMDNNVTREIMRDFRTNTLGLRDKNPDFKNIKAAIIFYRTDATENSNYRMSMHSIDGYADRLKIYVKKNNSKIDAGGHADRVGGKIDSIKNNDVNSFINAFLDASQKVN